MTNRKIDAGKNADNEHFKKYLRSKATNFSGRPVEIEDFNSLIRTERTNTGQDLFVSATLEYEGLEKFKIVREPAIFY